MAELYGDSKLLKETAQPELSSESVHYLNAFQRLSSSRSVGMAMGAIPLSEITNYCNYFEESEPMIFIDILLQIDAIYLNLRSKDKTTEK